MLVGAVAGVNHRYIGKLGQHARGTVFGVALDNGIGVAGNDAGGIGQRFAFFGAGVGTVGKTDYLAAQTLHSGFK